MDVRLPIECVSRTQPGPQLQIAAGGTVSPLRTASGAAAIKRTRNARACAREAPGYSLNSRDFRRARSPQARLTECFHLYRLHTMKRPSVARHRRQRCASRRAPMGAVEERIHRGAGSGAYRCAARLAPRAERSAWSWTSTLEIRPDLENDEIADWRRRGHRDADARRGARFYPGRRALPHHRDMAPFIPLWNECRRHFGLAGHPYRLRIGTSA